MQKDKISLFFTRQDNTLVNAMQLIDNNSAGVLFVIDENNHLIGSLSDGDVRRWILKTGCINSPVYKVMNCNPTFCVESDDVDYYALMNDKSIKALPILDGDGNISDIVFADSSVGEIVKNRELLKAVPAIIMAGGKGTRLYPYTKILPKPLIPIGDIPILERILDVFRTTGVSQFYLTVNYKKNMIKSYFTESDKKFDIEYVDEDKPLGTAGSIRLIDQKFDCPLFVTNCDTLIRTDYSEVYDYHIKSGNAITIVTALKHDVIPYGVITAKSNGEIEQIVEKPQRSYLINTGMYIINPEMIDYIPADQIFHMTNLVEKALNDGCKVGMYPVSEDSFLDMGEIAEMKRMEEKLRIK